MVRDGEAAKPGGVRPKLARAAGWLRRARSFFPRTNLGLLIGAIALAAHYQFAVPRADYVIRIVAVTGNRVVWESEPMTAAETRLPATVALEPEVHQWSVTARKGGEVIATSATQRFTITP